MPLFIITKLEERKQMIMKKKIIITITMLALVICFTIGGTLAWLMDTTDPVKNTFTSGDVDITLTETPNTNITDDDETNDSWSAQMIPGNTYAKDPKVTVIGATDAVDCWLFVKVEEKGNAQTYLDYSFTFDNVDGWNQLNTSTEGDTTTTVWYREVTASETDQSWYLLDGNKDEQKYANGFVIVDPEAVTKGTVDTAANAELVFTAYAAQKDNRTVEEAWALFNN